MKKLIAMMAVFLLCLSAYPVVAHGSFSDAEQIIEDRIPCDELDEQQLEQLGDYYMEQMHPGQAHEIMDKRMGGEGSESLRVAHINMARSFYCGEHDTMGAGMMNAMMGRDNFQYGSGRGPGMMNGYWGWNNTLGNLSFLILVAFIFAAAFWLAYRIIIKTNDYNKKHNS